MITWRGYVRFVLEPTIDWIQAAAWRLANLALWPVGLELLQVFGVRTQRTYFRIDRRVR